ncbi:MULTISPECIES: response regulator [Pseudomonas]|uniref:response regulator n=1 Tax=Pseudomonas TaxID=286 RepID=UPI0010C05E63|nr:MULTISPECIES: response regulator [Pseudomonas]MBD8193363.1 response regulator [Pseudomonas fluorescens]MBD8228549.1 response regulator [Pseudomonas fluorescens]MBD8737898.1 response regulator [Pseudomonas fluorescens]MBD8786520.1 response regulator [Pseudomonas fluorescens]MBD8818380.1 response regulator [Pseudomonas fluorescens]
MRKIKVVIADDHPIVLVGVRELMSRDPRFKVVAEATSPTQLIAELTAHAPDVVLTDFNMPGDANYGDGLKLISYLVRQFPKTQIVVLTMISSSLILSRLHQLGVVAVLQKSQLQDEIQHALDALTAYRQRQNAEGAASLASASIGDVDERLSSLSPKELEVLRLFMAGSSVGSIALQLKRSAKTVSAQKVAAMRKLKVTSDLDLVSYCITAGQFI